LREPAGRHERPADLHQQEPQLGLAGGEDGEVFNVNADTVAESLAVALRAQKLIFLTGAPGVLRDRNDASTLVTFADPDDLAGLMASGVLAGGMRPKVEAAADFVRASQGRGIIARLSDGPAALRGDTGTTITRDP
jgi:carbamate kinase